MMFTAARYEIVQPTKNREKPMGPVMVRCPKTGSSIRTSIVTDRKSFNATPVFFGRVHCPICRTVHEWFAKDAWVSEAEPAPQPRLKKIA